MIKNMQHMLEKIFSTIDFPREKETMIIEVGTGYGYGTTKYINDIMLKEGVSFQINSYEGVKECYDSAAAMWNSSTGSRVRVINKFFCDKGDVESYVLPNIVGEGSALTKEHYLASYSTMMETGDFETDLEYTPDIVFIDSWRFSHAAIVNKCLKYCNKNTIFIVEDDFQVYGEEKILKKYFNLKNLKRFDGDLSAGVWNFITFNL